MTTACESCAAVVSQEQADELGVCEKCLQGPPPSPADMPATRTDRAPVPVLQRPAPGERLDHAQLADQCAQHAEHWLAKHHDHPSSLAIHRARDYLALGQLHARIALAVSTRVQGSSRPPARGGGVVPVNVGDDGIPEFYARERI